MHPVADGDQEAIREAVRAFAQAEPWPHAPRWDRDHSFPKEAHAGLAALGACGICVPEDDGGAGLDLNDFPLERIYRDVRVCQILMARTATGSLQGSRQGTPAHRPAAAIGLP
ncbi:acyl-CoA dehydrogenase family protein [Variovorax brevis]|uniref:acyl-CoA dehydrogenase family protein n=1 Tax=Variovorax brevis TaxID=3053503 RepID=UPI0040383289